MKIKDKIAGNCQNYVNPQNGWLEDAFLFWEGNFSGAKSSGGYIFLVNDDIEQRGKWL